jgi:hypothetical protein
MVRNDAQRGDGGGTKMGVKREVYIYDINLRSQPVSILRGLGNYITAGVGWIGGYLWYYLPRDP